MNLERAQGAKARAEQRMKLFRYYYECYTERGALKPKVKEEALRQARIGLSRVKDAKTRLSVGEYLVAKNIFDKASDELGKAIHFMHERSGV